MRKSLVQTIDGQHCVGMRKIWANVNDSTSTCYISAQLATNSNSGIVLHTQKKSLLHTQKALMLINDERYTARIFHASSFGNAYQVVVKYEAFGTRVGVCGVDFTYPKILWQCDTAIYRKDMILLVFLRGLCVWRVEGIWRNKETTRGPGGITALGWHRPAFTRMNWVEWEFDWCQILLPW